MATETNKKNIGGNPKSITPDFFGRVWEKSWTYIKTVVDVVREPVLILDENLCVLAANESFYQTFQVKPKDTENNLVYKLGNGQWDISSLRKLLEDILPKNVFFKGFEVAHDFPFIGRKIMILNARQIYFKDDVDLKAYPPIILLAMEDVTDMMGVAEMLADHTNKFEEKMAERARLTEVRVSALQKEIGELKNKSQG